MGAPKQKWTPEEESALRAGVEKYGAGKWRAIQKDPKFAPILQSRSNVDLKDKWRNLSSTNTPGGQRVTKATMLASAPIIKKPVEQQPEIAPLAIEPPSFPDSYYFSPASFKLPPEKSHMSKYDDYILEAIATLNDPSGSYMADIADFVETHFDVPVNFRKFLNSRLKSLVLQYRASKVDQRYKIYTGAPAKRKQESDDEKAMGKKSRQGTGSCGKPKLDLETCQRLIYESQELTAIAVRAIVEAEVLAAEAEQSFKEANAFDLQVEHLEAVVEAKKLMLLSLAPSSEECAH